MRTIVLEQVQGEMTRCWPSTGAKDKAAKLDAMEKCFQTRSWTEMEKKFSLESLQEGLGKLRELTLGAPSEDGGMETRE
jgi:hypothetical protein